MGRFTGQNLRVVDIPASYEPNVVDGHEFIDCTLRGPAVIGVLGCQFDRCVINFDASGVDSVIWAVPLSRPTMVGAIPFVNCTFRGVTFKRIGFAVSEPAAGEFAMGILGWDTGPIGGS